MKATLPSSLPMFFLALSDVGADGRHEGLQLRVVRDTFDTALAAEAGVLHAAERTRHVDRVRVDSDRAGDHLTGDLETTLRVGRPNAAGQSERGVVGDPDRVRLVLVGDDAVDRAEDLFLGDAHGVVDVREYRLLDVPADRVVGRDAAAEGHGRAL